MNSLSRRRSLAARPSCSTITLRATHRVGPGARTFMEEGGHRLQGYKEEDGTLGHEGKRAEH
ncbi:hypothetical protein DPMN_186187 [Dreissena polymorpha]|uniref:Uncharacterized protein n=1 Tax=Dreissena polymorpha TaxID=45954 RepID=A0A9D4DLU6_DREPO|nr:hypothetical protein DPMN_186187 [Dreissena polymorpha]